MSRFTAVIPLYNKAKTINRAIRSVLGQTGAEVRLVIVDDGSTDGSVEAIDKAHLPSIELVRQVNAGPGRARNAGAARAKGEFIAFLDADDEWEPGYLAAAAEALDKHPECAAYVAAYTAGAQQHIQKNVLLELIPETGPRAPDGFRTPAEIKAYVDCFHSSSTVVRSASFRHYGGFFDRERSLYGEDSYLWLQIAFGERVYFDRTSLVHFHVEDSALGAKQRGRHPRRPALIFPEPLYENCPPARRPQLETLLAFYRLIETEKLVAQRRPADLAELRRTFPWPRGVLSPFYALREVRVSALSLLNHLMPASGAAVATR